MNKFSLLCKSCNYRSRGFVEWFSHDQRCRECGSTYSEVIYDDLGERLVKTFARSVRKIKGMWHYFDVLPLQCENYMVTAGEGDVNIDRWGFLEAFAMEMYDIECRVYAHRQDNNNATGSFKDLAGSLVASSLSENKIYGYVVASTGNIGVAFARYVSAYGGTLYVFIPRESPKFQEAEVTIFGQKVFRVQGDYDNTKRMASLFSGKHNLMLAGGTFDPLRVEAKKTMAFEWFRQLEEFPTVYIQALSGGTGPIGIAKGCKELIEAGLAKRTPRLILVQSSKCSPMADAWSSAEKGEFVQGWQNSYPVYRNPESMIHTLATGNPTGYPILAKLVKKVGGRIITFDEELVFDVAKIVAYETAVRIGPAASIAVGGFFKALKQKLINPRDIVLINIGEGVRRAPDFMVQSTRPLIPTGQDKEIEFPLFDRSKYNQKIWERLKGSSQA
jgi:threonine synthase